MPHGTLFEAFGAGLARFVALPRLNGCSGEMPRHPHLNVWQISLGEGLADRREHSRIPPVRLLVLSLAHDSEGIGGQRPSAARVLGNTLRAETMRPSRRSIGVTTLLLTVACVPIVRATSPRAFFYSPTRVIECRFSNGAVACGNFRTGRVGLLNPTGRPQYFAVRQGFGNNSAACKKFPTSEDVPCWFQPFGAGPTLPVGETATDPDLPDIYRCASTTTGIDCRSLKSGKAIELTK